MYLKTFDGRMEQFDIVLENGLKLIFELAQYEHTGGSKFIMASCLKLMTKAVSQGSNALFCHLQTYLMVKLEHIEEKMLEEEDSVVRKGLMELASTLLEKSKLTGKLESWKMLLSLCPMIVSPFSKLYPNFMG